MRVLLYSEYLDKISKSGLGKSIKHQMKALESVGIEYTVDPEEPFDLLHINTYFPQSMLFAQKCRAKGIPVVYHAHSTKEDFENSFILSNQIAPFFKLWLIACYNMGDVLITPTPYSQHLLESYNIKRDIYALSNGIELSQFAPIPNARTLFRQKYNITEDEFTVIGIGLYLERKGILEFVELAKRLPHIRFIWFGYTDLTFVPTKIKEAVQNPPINLIFAGYVDNKEIIQAMQGCDLFLFTTFEETEGIPAVEACAAKVNFVVRDIPVFDDWLIDQHNVYKAKDIDDFERIIQGFANRQFPSLVEEAYSVAKSRDLHAIGKQLEAIYQKAIEVAEIRKKRSLFDIFQKD